MEHSQGHSEITTRSKTQCLRKRKKITCASKEKEAKKRGLGTMEHSQGHSEITRRSKTKLKKEEMARQYILSQLKERFIVLYPDYKTETYFIPPVIINRIPLEIETVVNQTVLKPKSSDVQPHSITKNKTLDETSGAVCNHSSIVSPGFQHSDLREDLSVQLVKSRLKTLAREQNELMFVLTQLDFSDYLSKPCYSRTIEQLHLTTPRNLDKNEYRRGTFDLLLFHKTYGILIGEIKSVGSPHTEQTRSQITPDSVIQDKVKQAIKQLVKSEVVIKELTKDLEPNVRIMKTVILPYIWKTDLQRVISANVELKNNLVSCLNAKDDIHAQDLCLLAENVSDFKGSWEVQQIQSWWEKCVSSKEDTLMNDDLYLDIVVRFCGPATTIRLHCIKSPRLEVRTKGEGVSVVGERMAQLILTPEHLQLLCEMPRNVFLCGPPGTGKSILLVLMALKHLQKGHDVCVMSTVSVNIAASLAMKNMLEKNMAEITSDQHGEIHYVQAYLENSDDELTKLIATVTEAAEKKSLFVIVDDVWAIDEDQIKRHVRFANEICELCNVNLWVSCMRHDKIPPVLHEVNLIIPLRSPPTVLEEIEESFKWYTKDKMHRYSTKSLPAPCDGPEVIHLQHLGHKECWPTNCEECGKTVGKVLNELGVGEGTGNSASKFGEGTKEAPPLTFGDVFVLTRSTDVQSSGFVTGLRQSGICKVRVLKSDCSLEEREDVALERNNEVVLTWYYNVMGLERKVVVFLPHRNKSDDNRTDDELEAYGRNHAMSRCTSQLIVVHTSLSRESVKGI